MVLIMAFHTGFSQFRQSQCLEAAQSHVKEYPLRPPNPAALGQEVFAKSSAAVLAAEEAEMTGSFCPDDAVHLRRPDPFPWRYRCAAAICNSCLA
jgi:hypothetical protein